jgi:hypothetical protein
VSHCWINSPLSGSENTSAFLAGNPVNFPHLARVGPLYDNAVFRPEPTLPLLPINPAKWIHITGESERVAKSMPRHGTEFRDEASSPCAPSILMLIGVA